MGISVIWNKTFAAPLSGHMKIIVHDEAYARIHLGILGVNLDFFLARVCFKGGTEYNINILQVGKGGKVARVNSSVEFVA